MVVVVGVGSRGVVSSFIGGGGGEYSLFTCIVN